MKDTRSNICSQTENFTVFPRPLYATRFDDLAEALRLLVEGRVPKCAPLHCYYELGLDVPLWCNVGDLSLTDPQPPYRWFIVRWFDSALE